MSSRATTGPWGREGTMEAEKIHLTKEKETYLATLYGKAIDAAAEHPILDDRFAAGAVARIDYDFEALKLPKGARDHPADAGPALRPVHPGVPRLKPRVDSPAPRRRTRHPRVSDRPGAEGPMVRRRPSRRHRAERAPVSGARRLSPDRLLGD